MGGSLNVLSGVPLHTVGVIKLMFYCKMHRFLRPILSNICELEKSENVELANISFLDKQITN